MIPKTINERNRYAGGEDPEAGDVIVSDGISLLVLTIEPGDADSFGGNLLRGVPKRRDGGWMDGDATCLWLPWRCTLVRRGALEEIHPAVMGL